MITVNKNLSFGSKIFFVDKENFDQLTKRKQAAYVGGSFTEKDIYCGENIYSTKAYSCLLGGINDSKKAILCHLKPGVLFDDDINLNQNIVNPSMSPQKDNFKQKQGNSKDLNISKVEKMFKKLINNAYKKMNYLIFQKINIFFGEEVVKNSKFCSLIAGGDPYNYLSALLMLKLKEFFRKETGEVSVFWGLANSSNEKSHTNVYYSGENDAWYIYATNDENDPTQTLMTAEDLKKNYAYINVAKKDKLFLRNNNGEYASINSDKLATNGDILRHIEKEATAFDLLFKKILTTA